MAFVKITTTYSYIGTSADTKPTTGVPAGSLFTETDTTFVYEYNGSSWTNMGFAAAGGPVATLVTGTSGAKNWQSAGPVTLLDITFTHVTHIGGVALDLSALTAGATLTIRVYKSVNGTTSIGPTVGVVVGTGAGQETYTPLDNSGDDCAAVAHSYKVTVASDTVGDNGKAIGYQYTTKVLG